MKSLLENATKADVFTDPFPHIVIKDALDDSLCTRLIEEIPSTDTLKVGRDSRAGYERFNYSASLVNNNPEISELWRQFIHLHSSEVFMHQALELMGEHILNLYPDFEKRFKPLQEFTSGVRKIDHFPEVDMLLDAQIAMNSSLNTPLKRIKRPHIDRPQVLFAGLYYMRHPDDNSIGGDLEIYRFKGNKPAGFDPNDKQHVNDEYVELVKTIKYDRNVLVLFLNSLNSLHGVTCRSSTPVPRYFVNLVGELPQRMFNYQKYQVPTQAHKKHWINVAVSRIAKRLSV
ncbi:MAG: hypothetical protein WA885_22690 [Phormidesmis sp.]